MIEKPKAIHGNWSDWKKWETCSQECGFGIRTRERTCDSPRWVAFIMANIKYRSPHKRTDAVFREAWFLYMVITVPNVSWMIFMLVSIWLKLSWHCRKLISYPGIAQAAGGSFKKTNCCHAVIFVFPLKNNRHDTFLTCRNCRWDRTWVYLDDTVVNCCQRVATRLFFMFPFGRKHYSDDSYNTFASGSFHVKTEFIPFKLFPC